MALAANPTYVMKPAKPARPGPRGVIKPGKAFNHFPEIIAAFPGAVSAIVIETTEALALAAMEKAPVEQDPRPGDPTPGTLRASTHVRFLLGKGSDLVVTGRVEFPAKDPRGHRYAKPLETGSIRKRRGRLVKVAARPFLVDAIVEERPKFYGSLRELESRLPR